MNGLTNIDVIVESIPRSMWTTSLAANRLHMIKNRTINMTAIRAGCSMNDSERSKEGTRGSLEERISLRLEIDSVVLDNSAPDSAWDLRIKSQ